MRVIVADDCPVYRQGLVDHLTNLGLDVVGEAETGEQALELSKSKEPDVAILDIAMRPVRDAGLIAAERMSTECPDIGVFILSQYAETRYAIRLFGSDPRRKGYWLKDNVADVSRLPEALRRIVGGESVVDPEIIERLTRSKSNYPSPNPLQELTPAELRVLALVAEGRSNQSIAMLLNKTRKTVDNQVTGMLHKMGIISDASSHHRVLMVLRYIEAIPHLTRTAEGLD